MLDILISSVQSSSEVLPLDTDCLYTNEHLRLHLILVIRGTPYPRFRLSAVFDSRHIIRGYSVIRGFSIQLFPFLRISLSFLTLTVSTRLDGTPDTADRTTSAAFG